MKREHELEMSTATLPLPYSISSPLGYGQASKIVRSSQERAVAFRHQSARNHRLSDSATVAIWHFWGLGNTNHPPHHCAVFSQMSVSMALRDTTSP